MVRELPPPAALAPWVECFWIRNGNGSDTFTSSYRVFPDGCLDIVFSPDEAFVVGTMTSALVVPSGRHVPMLGVRFKPGMATEFLQVPAVEFTDERAPLDDIWSDGSQVADFVGSTVGSDAAASHLTRVLLERLPRTAGVPADLRAAVDSIVTAAGRVDVARLAASLGVSRQHLARRFATYVGVPPKTFSRVMRLQALIRAAGPGRLNWAALAAELGYYDQPHLVAEFRSLTGLTPSRWASSKSPSPPDGSRVLSSRAQRGT